MVEWVNDTGVLFSDAAWNAYASASSDPATTLAMVDSQRGFGSPVMLPQGPKLVVVDLETNGVKRA